MRPDEDAVLETVVEILLVESLDCPLQGGVSVGLCKGEGVPRTMAVISTVVSLGLLWLLGS